MMDQMIIATLIGPKKNTPLYRRAKSEDEFYEELGSSPIVRFAAWLTGPGMKHRDAYSPRMPDACDRLDRSMRHGGLLRP